MPVNINQILQTINEISPEKLAEKWDNGGIQIETGKENIENILVSMEITDEIIKEAINKKVDMIITHHPLIFGSINKITRDWMGSTIVKLIQNNICVYSAHTSFDSVIGGNNDYLAHLLDIKDISAIEEIHNKYYKIVVYVPNEALEEVRESLFQSGAGKTNNYSHCTFSQQGVGTFMPLEEAQPYIGNNQELTYVDEYRVESIVPENKLKKVIESMLKAHPYEEPAYDVFLMENTIGKLAGLGRIGELEQEKTLENICLELKKVLNIQHEIPFIGDKDKKVKRVAICTGGGADFIKKASFKGCQLLVTGDVRYHDAQLAKQLGIAVIDASHFHTEKIFVQNMTQQLKQKLNNQVNIIESQKNINPFQFI